MGIIDEARRGRITDEMREVAKLEGISPHKVRDRIASGRLIIIRNIARGRPVRPVAVGAGARTKVNVNLGTSDQVVDVGMELRKAELANKYADTMMDLSTGGDLDSIRASVLKASEIPVGTVPVYQAFIYSFRQRGGGAYFSKDDLFKTIERHLKDGVDFMTLHMAVTKDLAVKALRAVAAGERMSIVSRGGDMLIGWMLHNNAENPLWSDMDYVFELFKQYDAVISIGDALRPGAIADAHDEFQVAELLNVARIVKRARKAGVQVMVEGPGHVPLNEIVWDVKLEKKLTGGAPYYVLGPLPTDVAAPYDHIASAVGAALAAAAGADLLCYLTPAEHLSLPTVEQTYEGIMAYKVAAHIADVVKLGERAAKWDREVADYRGKLEWGDMIKRLIDPERAYRVWSQFGVPKVRGCTMCGGYCPMVMAMDQAKRAGYV
ncbi:MAG: phosphomethylpyrimidine synthase ThiC [Thermoproteus sp. AZ2]|uniref:Phosphomethylpyrimidine synthase ThiC n=1 Tax=Thermoproteus sp. AZ2 TaxID=1609232 RepID=A0ACC6UZZ7_9CREN